MLNIFKILVMLLIPVFAGANISISESGNVGSSSILVQNESPTVASIDISAIGIVSIEKIIGHGDLEIQGDPNTCLGTLNNETCTRDYRVYTPGIKIITVYTRVEGVSAKHRFTLDAQVEEIDEEYEELEFLGAIVPSGSNPLNMGIVSSGKVYQKVFFKNNGAKITKTLEVLRQSGDGFSVVVDRCSGTTLGSMKSCSFVVEFESVDLFSGAYTGMFLIKQEGDSNGVSYEVSAEVSLSRISNKPKMEVSLDKNSSNEICLGDDSIQDKTSCFYNSASSQTIEVETLESACNQNKECSVSLSYTPPNDSVNFNITVNFKDNQAPEEIISYAEDSGSITVTKDFNNAHQVLINNLSGLMSFHVENNSAGGVAVPIPSISFNQSIFSLEESSTCPNVILKLKNGETCSFVLTLNDVSQAASYQDSIIISSGDSGTTVVENIQVDVVSDIVIANQAPVAQGFSLSLNEDESAVLPLSGIDSDYDFLTFQISTPPNNAQIESQEGIWTIIPNENFFGTVIFGYKAFDGEDLSSEVLISVEVNAVNDAPAGVDVVKNTSKDQQLIFSLPVSDVEDSNLTIEVLDTTRGSVLIQNNQITYTPESGFLGYDGFTYKVIDEEDLESGIYYVDLTVIDSIPGQRWNELSLPVVIKVPVDIDEATYNSILNVRDKWNDALDDEVLIIEQEGLNQEYSGLYDSLSDFVYSISFQHNNWFPGESSTLATTVLQTVGDNYIINVDILFNYFLFPFSTTEAVPGNMVDFESVLLHEMGHLLGLPHISPAADPASIMNPTFDFGEEKRDLSIYDYQSIRGKYSLQQLEELPPETNANYMSMEVKTHDYSCTHVSEDLN